MAMINTNELAGTWLLNQTLQSNSNRSTYELNGTFNVVATRGAGYEDIVSIETADSVHFEINCPSDYGYQAGYSDNNHWTRDVQFYGDGAYDYRPKGYIWGENNAELWWCTTADSSNGLLLRTITITSKLAEVENGDTLLTWLKANATKQADLEPETTTNVVNIEYNGEMIATIESGKTATLHCADKKMSTDIVITAPEIPEVKLQEKTITENCEAVPDEGYDGFSKVTVNVPIPEGYVDPEGTKEITENGTYDIAEFESINVNIPIQTYEVYDGMVTISGGMISFTIDNVSYEAEDGMTWNEWIPSDYCQDEYMKDQYSPGRGNVYGPIGKLLFEGQGYTIEDSTSDAAVMLDDTIIANHAYYSMTGSY